MHEAKYTRMKKLLDKTMQYKLDYQNSDAGLTEFIIGQINKERIIAPDISDYAYKYFGIDDFIPSESCRLEGDFYYIPGHGGDHIISECVSSDFDTAADEYTVTVRFYADPGKTVFSHLVEYSMRKIDNNWAFLGYEITGTGLFEPFTYSV
ncbi:MAG: hypothetical protein PHZ09_09835 [Eubacteriales bacterium]|nr:hypothetical protein [Eubacteriales bacterium]